MSLAASASYIIAASGLSIIKDIRKAMQDADTTVAAQNSNAGAALPPAAAVHAGPIVHTAQIEPHRISQAAIQIGHQTVIYRNSPLPTPSAVQPCPSSDCHSRPTPERMTLQAPWEIWPWPAPSIALDHFKRAIPLPDMLSKGSLIDIFV